MSAARFHLTPFAASFERRTCRVTIATVLRSLAYARSSCASPQRLITCITAWARAAPLLTRGKLESLVAQVLRLEVSSVELSWLCIYTHAIRKQRRCRATVPSPVDESQTTLGNCPCDGLVVVECPDAVDICTAYVSGPPRCRGRMEGLKARICALQSQCRRRKAPMYGIAETCYALLSA